MPQNPCPLEQPLFSTQCHWVESRVCPIEEVGWEPNLRPGWATPNKEGCHSALHRHMTHSCQHGNAHVGATIRGAILAWQPHWLTCGPLMPWRSIMPNATLEAPPASFSWTIFCYQFHAPRIILQDSSHCAATLPNLSPSLEKNCCSHVP